MIDKANKDFTHLHVHSDASLKDGLGALPRLLGRAKDMGFGSIALTEHGSLANSIALNVEANRLGLKPIQGMEGYVSHDGVIGHITLLADGNRGWESLVKLNNLGHESDFKQPAFTIDELKANSDGLVCLTGCIASPLNQLPYGEAKSLAYQLKHVYGHKLFAELMFVNNDSLSWERALKLSNDVGLKKVVTNDVHFPYKGDAPTHSLLTRMKAGYDYESSNLFLRSYSELLEAAMERGFSHKDAVTMLERAGNIGKLIKPVTLSRDVSLPKTEFKRSLWEIVKDTPRWNELKKHGAYHGRLAYELGIIDKMGFESYFLILNDIVYYSKKEGVAIGPGRGSGAGSLVLYLLEITDIDPIELNLSFERFLNEKREGMPDVDIDIDAERRDTAINYAAKRWGAIPIATFSRWSHKSLVRDLGKQFHLDKEVVNELADRGPESSIFHETATENEGFGYAYNALLGQIRHKGRHAGGVIITDSTVPVERVGDTLAAAWAEGAAATHLSHAGIVKFDLLGLTAVSALRRMGELSGKKPPKPTDGDPTFSIFQEGRLNGIFQFSGSEGIRQLTMKLHPERFEDLIAINALYRPGPLDAGTTSKYHEWKKTPRKMHPAIDSVLEPTYGVIVYQEQVMEIYRLAVGGTGSEADIARRYISLKSPKKMEDPKWVKAIVGIETKFIKGAMKNFGMTHEQAMSLWSELLTHTRYSFNRSHSASYALISWRMAWYKKNFPAIFYTSMLNVDPENAQSYILDAVRDGLEIKEPRINESGYDYTTAENTIYLPLASAKWLGETGVNAIIEERKIRGPFKTISDFWNRVPARAANVRAKRSLFALGAFENVYDKEADEKALEQLFADEKLSEIISGGLRKSQLEYMGFIIPNKELLDRMERELAGGWEVGIVDDIDQRDSRWGPYKVYKLSPSGVFWARDKDVERADIKEGEPIAVKVSGKNGKLKKFKRL